jgi:tetratricopeptide (TPR) repeat protein
MAGLMPSPGKGGAASSFLLLQRVRQSFESAGLLDLRQRRAAFRMARELGATVIPLCVRALETAPLDDARARWACALLGHLAEVELHRPRVVKAVETLVRTSRLGDPVKLHALALLGDLGCPAPGGTRLGDASAAQERSERELIAMLTTAPEVAHAGDMLVTRLDTQEMLALVDRLSAKEPRRALRLLDELLLRNDIDDSSRRELKRIRAPLRDRQSSRTAGASTAPPGGQPVATAALGRHAGGRRIVVASRKLVRDPSRYRALCLLIDADGTLMDGMYRDDFTVDGVERDVLRPLRNQGYRFETASGHDAALLVIRTAQAARLLGRSLPRAFYLGRDLFAIYDEHAAGVAPEDDLNVLLDRANALLSAGQPQRARPLFERFVAQAPSNPDGCAALSMCLLALNDLATARSHLRRAAWLDAGNPNHHWNLAAIDHRQGRLGGCYLALTDYLDLGGEFDEAPGDSDQRRATAMRFVAEYERIARVEYPGADPGDVAQADELLARGRQRLEAGRPADAMAALEQAVTLVPDHYLALVCLGMALGECNQLAEARRCLDRALALRPGLPQALEALQRIEGLASMRPRRTRQKRRRSAKQTSGVEKGHNP